MTPLRDELRWFGPFLVITGSLFLIAETVGSTTGTNAFAIIASYALRIFVVAPFVALAGITVFIVVCAFRREPNPTKVTMTLVGSRFSSPATIVSVSAAVLMMPILMGSYGVVKMLMPLSRPFTWDAALASVDRILFLGVDAWRVTHALFGAPLPTRMLDVAYTAWVPGVLVSVLIAAMAPRVQRARFFLSFAASWLLIGVFAAYVFASAGPCFAQQLGTANASWFVPLMDRLTNDAAAPLNATIWQELLWQSHAARQYGFARGISAAPSMHNALCALYVLALANARPVLRVGAMIFAATIFVGSVHLGWHYAVDGLLGWAAMAAIWKAAGTYLDWCGYNAEDKSELKGKSDTAGEAKPVLV